VTEMFYGAWQVEVTGRDALYSQRFTIAGSDGSDGTYDGVVGTDVGAVTGVRWSIEMEWNDDAGSGWQPSGVRRFPTYTLTDGFVIHLGADDNFEQLRDHDYDDMVIRCFSLDPQVNPTRGAMNPLDFTITEEMLRDFERRQPDDPDPRGPRDRDPRGRRDPRAQPSPSPKDRRPLDPPLDH
jgi:hypothetical protein